MSARLRLRAIIIFTAALLPLEPGFGQSRGGSTGTTGGAGAASGAGSAAGTTRAPGSVPPTTSPGGNPSTLPRPGVLFLTGRVTLEDGTAPADTVAIERVCAGSARAEGYTDSHGYFSIQVGNESGVFQDASETSTNGRGGAYPMAGNGSPGTGGVSGSTGGAMSSDMRFANCDLRARLSGYRSQTVSLAGRRPLDDPNIGVILLHREGRDEGSTVSMVSLAAPHDARKAFEKGLQLIKKNKPEEAEKEYRKAVQIYPKYADAWNELGRLQLQRGQDDAASQLFHSAIEADPKYVNPYLQLSIIYMRHAQWKDLADDTDIALKLDPFDYPQAYLFNGVARWNLHQVDAAEKSAREADRLDSRHTLPQVSHLMALILLERHEYAGAADYLRLYLRVNPAADDAVKTRAQLAQVEKLLAQNGAPKPDR